MELATSRSRGVLTVETCRALDRENSETFERELERLVAENDRGIVVECGGLHYIGSAGLRTILALAKSLARRGKRLALCDLGRPMKRVFAITGFDKIIAIHPARQDAISAILR